MNIRPKMGHYFSLVLIGAIAFISGCSQARQDNPAKEGTSAALEEQYQYPHEKTWLSSHVGYVSKYGEKLINTTKDCTLCHMPKNAEAEGEDGVKMAIPQAQPRNVSCAIKCHSPQNGNPATTIPSHPVLENNQCLKCHAEHAKRSKPHYPAAAGLCKTCHEASPAHLEGTDPRGASTRNIEQTCYSCHFRMDKHSQVHTALSAGSSCAGCHDAHGSGKRYMLKTNSVLELCTQCHSMADKNHKSVHSALNSKQSCLGCHDPHSSEHKKVLTMPAQELCLTCHQKEKEKITQMPYVHAAVKAGENGEGGCVSCHNPHASKFDKLLANSYPVEGYAQYYAGDARTPNTYALCMNCHNASMLNKDIKGSETAFRDDKLVNGKIVSQNLHWFHVVDAAGSSHKTSGRTCFVCHDPHAANQMHNIKDGWQMSKNNGFVVNIEFSPTPSGGQCARSCHDLRTYKRSGE